MADYTSRLIDGPTFYGSTLDQWGTFLIWFFEAPEIPPPPGTGATLDNPSFETASGDVAGEPSAWSLYLASYSLAWVRFGAPFGYVESFAYGWTSNENSLVVFAPTDLSFATFGSSAVAWENYESEWLSNNLSIPAFEETHLAPDTFDAAADEFEDYEQEWPARHPVADYVRGFSQGLCDSSDPPTVYALLNEIKIDLTAHAADGTVHTSPDVANAITSPNAIDEATSITLAEEIRIKAWAHILDTSLDYHLPDTINGLSAPGQIGSTVTSFDGASFVAILTAVGLELHYTWASNTGPGAFAAFSETVSIGDPISDVVSYLVGQAGESYEEQWSNNENSLASFSPGDLGFVEFETNGPTEYFESYELAIDVQVLNAPGGEGAPYTLSPTQSVAVTFVDIVDTGVYAVQTLTRGSATWVTRDSVSAATPSPKLVEIGSGYSKLRIVTTTVDTGHPSASARWSELQ